MANEIKVIRCEVFSRICGYYRPIISWNRGKREEYRQRTMTDLKPMIDEIKREEKSRNADS